MDRRASTCQRHLNVVTMYCKVRELPDLLTKRVRRHMDYYLNHTLAFPENTILEQLTPKLRHYCVLQSNKQVRQKQTIFQRVPAAFVVDVAQRWMPVQVPPHTVLSREGEVGGDVFFVKTGSLNVVRLRGGGSKGRWARRGSPPPPSSPSWPRAASWERPRPSSSGPARPRSCLPVSRSSIASAPES